MKFIPNGVSATLVRAALQTRKHSPVIMFGAGVVGTVASTVLACKATLRIDEVLSKAEYDRYRVKQASDLKREDYTEKDADNDLRLVKIKLAGNLLKLYGPAIGVGVVSIGLLTGAHVTLTKRNAALSAAYFALDRGFKEYRERVRNELGEEKEREFRYGAIEKEFVQEGEHGHEVVRVKRINPNGTSIYARVFDELNPKWKPGPDYNRLFIISIQNFANDRLNSRGHLFLNEVYDMLGMERVPEGQVVGWVKGNGDGYIDFGLDEDRQQVVDFFNGDVDSIWLDFNVDGEVWKLI